MIDALIAVRAVHVAVSVAAAGALLFRLWVAVPALRGVGASAWRTRMNQQINVTAWSSLAIFFASAAVWLVLVASDVSGHPLGEGEPLRRPLRSGDERPYRRRVGRHPALPHDLDHCAPLIVWNRERFSV